jgi:hypothetical protein
MMTNSQCAGIANDDKQPVCRHCKSNSQRAGIVNDRQPAQRPCQQLPASMEALQTTTSQHGGFQQHVLEKIAKGATCQAFNPPLRTLVPSVKQLSKHPAAFGRDV